MKLLYLWYKNSKSLFHDYWIKSGANILKLLRLCLSIIQYLNQGPRYNLSFNNDWTTVLCCVEQVGHQKCQASTPVFRIFPGSTAYMGVGLEISNR